MGTDPREEKLRGLAFTVYSHTRTLLNTRLDLRPLFYEIIKRVYEIDDTIDVKELREFKFYEGVIDSGIDKLRAFLKAENVYDAEVEKRLITLRDLFYLDVQLRLDDNAKKLDGDEVMRRLLKILAIKSADLMLCFTIATMKTPFPDEVKQKLLVAFQLTALSGDLGTERLEMKKDKEEGVYNTFVFLDKYGIPRQFLFDTFVMRSLTALGNIASDLEQLGYRTQARQVAYLIDNEITRNLTIAMSKQDFLK